ncbi:unnamed protein product [Psylliodes chrysocephalus]|uniref:DNA mismatch repair proteins mutS family domain-containing protein n=1 Tax=Psylliodes chrysocephalus TaxID=3402493 RepID=A0A9P0CKJ7_9CUCU|nr:unnamed protein product [Psylliodes chrysocephala]
MNLNECVLNRRIKSKPRLKFIATGKCEEQDNNDRNLTRPDSSRECLSEPMELTKTNKKKSTLLSTSNWGSGGASVATSSSNRRSTSSKIPSETQSRTIVALTEGRGQARCEVGIAVINLSSPVLVISQISDSHTYINTLTKINIFNPTDILFPQTFENVHGNRLMTKIKTQFPKIKYNAIHRRLFNKLNGLDMLSKLCIPSLNGIVLVLQHRYYALAATSALLSYIQDNLYIYYAAGTIKIDYQESEGYALIDVATADRLELVCSAKPSQANKHSSLLGILNHCYTKMGTRMLRSWILQPLFNISYIQARLDCVDELMKNQEVLSHLQILLQKLCNMESVLNIATLVPQDPYKCSIRQVNYILNLRSIVDLINPLREIILVLKQPFFVRIRNTLEDSSFVKIREMIGEFLTEEAQPTKSQLVNHQWCYSIKPKINELLDVVRKIYCERVNDMKDYVRMLEEKYNLPFTLGNNQKKGYHIILNINRQEMKTFKKCDLPDEFVEIQSSSNAFTMKTPELVNISTRVDVILDDILKISNVIVHNIIVNVKQYIPLFNKFCEEVAQLDIYQSLAQASLENNYIRPDFGDYTQVKNGQHPMLNVLMPSKSVANNIFCSDDYNVHIITGPNGSGKSIFIRQVILLQIMAQLGSYIPAESAIFKPANKMCARINLDDNMEYNASSFVLEMKEIKYIMSTMTNDSLILIDELGRSTSVEEGVSVAMAILEKLSSFRSHIFITTHFSMLGKFSSIYPYIKTWQMETIPIGTNPKTLKLNYTYNKTSGFTQISRYGVYIVRNIWPDEILKIVDDSIDRLETQQYESIFYPMDEKAVVKYNIESNLRLLKEKRLLSIPKIKKIITGYKEKLKRLNYNIKDITFSINTSKQDPKLTSPENVNTDGEYLLQQQEEEQQFENIFPSNFTKENHSFNLQEIPNFDFSDKHSIIVSKENSLNCSYSTENSEFIKMLHPIIDINESCPDGLDFQRLLSTSKIIESPNFNSITHDFLDNNLVTDLSEALTSPPRYFKDISSNSSNVKTISHKRNKSPVKYISPIVNIVQGLNNTTLSNSSFDDIPRNDCMNLENKIHQKENNTSTINRNDSHISSDPAVVTSISGLNNSTSKTDQELPSHLQSHTIVKDIDDHNLSRKDTSSSDNPDNDNVSSEYSYRIKDQKFNSSIKGRTLDTLPNHNSSIEKGETIQNSISSLSNKKMDDFPEQDSKLNQLSINQTIISDLTTKLTLYTNSSDNSNSVSSEYPNRIKDQEFNVIPIHNSSIKGRKLDTPPNHNSSIGTPIAVEKGKTLQNSISTLSNKKIDYFPEQHSKLNQFSINQTIISDLTKELTLDTHSSDNSNSVSSEYPSRIKDIPIHNSSIKGRKLAPLPNHNSSIGTPIAGEKGEILQNSISTLSNKKIDYFPEQDSKLNQLSINQTIISDLTTKLTLYTNSSDNSNSVSSEYPNRIKDQEFNVIPIHNSSIKGRKLDTPPNHNSSIGTPIAVEKGKTLQNSISTLSNKKIDDFPEQDSKLNQLSINQTIISDLTTKLTLYTNSSDNSNSVSSEYPNRIKDQEFNVIPIHNSSIKGRKLDTPPNQNSSIGTPIAVEKGKTLQNSISTLSNKKIDDFPEQNSKLNQFSKNQTIISDLTTKVTLDTHSSDNSNSVSSEYPNLIKDQEFNMIPIQNSSTKRRKLGALPNRNTLIKKRKLGTSRAVKKGETLQDTTSTLSNKKFDDVPKHDDTRSSDIANIDNDNVSSEHSYRIEEQEFNMIPSQNSSIKRRKPSTPIVVEKEDTLQNSISTLSNKKIEDFPEQGSKVTDETKINSSSSSNQIKKKNLIRKSRLNYNRGNVFQNFPNETNSTSQNTSNKSNSTPFRNIDSEASSSKSNSYNEIRNKNTSVNENKVRKRKLANVRKKFIPPRKLSAKQIKEEFEEQDREIMNNGTPNSANISRYVERSMNRPSVNQIQNTTYLGTLRKNAEGFNLIVPKPKVYKNKKNVIKSDSTNTIDITIFSDRNANAFERFITSDETDFRNFHFSNQKTVTTGSQRSEDIFDYYMSHSQIKSTQSQNNFNMTLTPNGYYKQNKMDINNVINKYLSNNSCSSITRFNESQSEKAKNIFESNHSGLDDFDL